VFLLGYRARWLELFFDMHAHNTEGLAEKYTLIFTLSGKFAKQLLLLSILEKVQGWEALLLFPLGSHSNVATCQPEKFTRPHLLSLGSEFTVYQNCPIV